MPGQIAPAGGLLYFKFTTRAFATGIPTILTGSPVVSVYKDDNTTEVTTGVTLTANFDSRAGLNHVTIDTSSDGTFYANGHKFYLVITTGTVDSVSVVNEVVGEFELAAALGPAAGGVTLADAVAHGGTPGSSTATLALKSAQIKNTSGNALTLDSSDSAIYATSDVSNGDVIHVEATGIGDANAVRLIGSGSSRSLQLDSGITINSSNSGDPCVYIQPFNFGDSGIFINVGGDGVGLSISGGLQIYGSNPSNPGIMVTSQSGNPCIGLFPYSAAEYGFDGTLSPATLASYFTIDTTKVYTDAVSGSVVKEIASNAKVSPSNFAG